MSEEFALQRQQAHKLASKFFVLLGQPERYNNTSMSDVWDLEMLHVLKQPGMTYEIAMEMLNWVFKHPFWSSRMHIAKNFAENIDAIRDAHDAEQRSQKLEKNCICPRKNGQLVIDELGPIYDASCPLHGLGAGLHLTYRMDKGKLLPVVDNAGHPPRKGEPGFEEHMAQMNAVLNMRPRRREETE